MSDQKRYLGDGVYIDLWDQGVVLTAENGIRALHRICLDRTVIRELIGYLKADENLRYLLK